MRSNDVGSIVFSSSCATYGIPTRLPIVETERQEPINPYGRSKLMGEMILRDACAAHGLAAVALRYFNAAGADPDGDCGEEHDPETHLVPLVLQAAAGLRSDVAVFGSDYDTEDGTCIRDYVHVTDLASAHVAALSAAHPGKFAAYNLGTGAGSSISQVITRVREITRKRISVTTAARRPGDPPVLVADAARARAELKWAPSHSDPDHIIQSAWLWMTAHRKSAING
jgi:UDP-arabinose 4-epimerase